MGRLSATLLWRIRLWILSRNRHRTLLRRLGRLGLERLGLGLGPELVWRLGVRQWRLLQPLWLPRWAIRRRVCRPSGLAARRRPPFRSLVPERSTRGTVWGRIARFAERHDQIGQLEFLPIARLGKLDPVWIGDGVKLRESINDRERSQRRPAERRSRNPGSVATLPGCATQPGSGTAIFRSSTAIFRSGSAILRFSSAILRSSSAILRSSSAVLRSSTAIFRSGTAILRFGTAIFRSELQRGRA
jgi:hypothetical protein